MRLMSELVDMLSSNRKTIPKISATGTCARDIRNIYDYNRDILEDYLLASIENGLRFEGENRRVKKSMDSTLTNATR